MLEPAIEARVRAWLSPVYSPETRASIEASLQEGLVTELTDSFYRDLEFGTGGLRGVMGVGTNRINIYTVATATQGLAEYLKEAFPDRSAAGSLSVVIGYDSRNNSALLARTTAEVMAANGIQAYLFPQLRPTPLVSYAIRRLACQSGVVLTASHNPKEYNGYKAYWDDGGQIIPPHDEAVIRRVQAVGGYENVRLNFDPALITLLDETIDEAYLDYVSTLSLSGEAIARQQDLKIVYSPLHGTGITLVPKILERFGFRNVQIVEEQAEPDGNFPTVRYPNPEETDAMNLALALAASWGADLVMATDPDADRVGIGLRDGSGHWVLLNGNQTATLLFYYMLEANRVSGHLTGNEMIVKTIVTTDLLDRMALEYGVHCFNTLTGFKYIAGVMAAQEGRLRFICGGEESYGYLIGDQVRDKDAISSCAMIAEMVAYARDKGQSLFDLLISIYQRYGYYREGLISITRKGKAGAEEIADMMRGLRAEPPTSIGGSPVVRILDYDWLESRDLTNGVIEALDYERSNVLQFITADGTKVSARPSGTEPKIKFYISVNAPLSGAEAYAETGQLLEKRIAAIAREMGLA